MNNSYCFQHTPREGSKTGGGVGILYSKSIKLLSYTKYPISSCECSIVSLRTALNNTIKFIIIYQPPSNNYITFLDDFNDLLTSIKLSNTIILGDFNFQVNKNKTPSKQLISLSKSHSLHQHITAPTHTSGNILDLVFTINSPQLMINITNTNFLITDHYAITFTINTPIDKSQINRINYRNISKIPISLFTSYVSSLISNETTIKELNKYLIDMLNKFAPTKLKIIKSSKNKWFNNDTILAKRAMRTNERYFSKFPSNSSLTALIESKKYFKYSIECAKKKFYLNEILNNSNNIRKLYCITNSLLGKTKKSIFPDTPLELLCFDFANFFTEKLKKLRLTYNFTYNPHFNVTPQHLNIRLSYFIPTNHEQIFELINHSKSSAPHDPIPLLLLKKMSRILTIPITLIINRSMSTGIVPPELKHAIISPILKKNKTNHNLLNNYRPISQLPTIAKILEKIVSNQLNNYLLTNKLIDDYKSAYRVNHSTETTVIHVIDNILRSLDVNKHIQLLLLDLSAAFDTLDHSILYTRLTEIGLDDIALDWMISFISNRSFSVKTGQFYSKNHTLESGVPQGSVLGPILFLIYIKPLSHIIRQFKHIRYLYADDILIYSTLSRYISMNCNDLSNCANAIYIWLNDNKLSLNTSKSELLNIPSNFDNFPIVTINGKVIEPSINIKYLGVIFDSDIKFNTHIMSLCKKANHQLYNIRHIRNYINTNTCRILINSLVFSIIDYCNSILVGLPKSSLIPINRIIRSSVRLIHRQPRTDHTSVSIKMRIDHILSTSQRSNYRLLCIIHKTMRIGQPAYIRSCLNIIQPRRTLRSNHDTTRLSVRLPNLSRSGNRAFTYSAPSRWNSLPRNIRGIQDHSTFKRNLKLLLLNS